MKKLALMLVTALAVFSTNAKANTEALNQLMLNDLQVAIATELHINNVINWKVGEYQEYSMDAVFGNIGTMKKLAASEQGNAIWIKSDVSGMAKQSAEALIDRATGQIIEYRQDGKKTEVPNDKLEIISQDTTSVTVPAGTFEAIHIVAKSEKIKKLEVWANPRDITLDGSAQMMIDAGMLPITLKLTKFGGR